jgi:DUF971 family protein
MTEDLTTTPIEFRAPRGARILEVQWADGHTGIYPHAVLRGFCPCAHCQGHDGPVRYVSPPATPNALELESIEEVGHYAVRLGWGDGHATGIYSFRFLRDLCSCRLCEPPPAEERHFPR